MGVRDKAQQGSCGRTHLFKPRSQTAALIPPTLFWFKNDNDNIHLIFDEIIKSNYPSPRMALSVSWSLENMFTPSNTKAHPWER